MRRWPRVVVLLATLAVVPSCHKSKRYTTTVEVMQVRRFGQGTGMVDLDLRYVDCPGDARRYMRGDKTYAACAQGIKKGDKLAAEVVLSYNADRGSYRNELVRLGDCPVKLDLKDEANYERFQDCRDVVASGATVGVRCNRRRDDALLDKCPWLRRQ